MGNTPATRLEWTHYAFEVEGDTYNDDPGPLEAIFAETSPDDRKTLIETDVVGHGAKFTALHLACWRGEGRVVRWLVSKAGAHVEARDADGRTPLFFACFFGHLSIVEYLVDEAGANIEAEDDWGLRALHCATYHHKTAVVKYLLSKGATKLARTTKDYNGFPAGSTAMDIARQRGFQSPVVGLSSPAPPASPSFSDGGLCSPNRTPIAEARKACKTFPDETGIIQARFKDAPNAFVDPSRRRTAVHQASINGNIGVLKWLVDTAGASLEARDRFGEAPLFQACYTGHLDVVKYLVDCGANVEAADYWGMRPLHIAIFYEEEEIVEYLLSIGVDCLAKPTKDFANVSSTGTALDLAHSTGNHRIIDMVEAAVLRQQAQSFRPCSAPRSALHEPCSAPRSARARVMFAESSTPAVASPGFA